MTREGAKDGAANAKPAEMDAKAAIPAGHRSSSAGPMPEFAAENEVLRGVQTVKAPAPGARRGFDAGKKTVGRKRHVVVDTDGRLLMVNLTSADISDSAGAQMILDGIRKRWPWMKHLFADGAYDRTQLMNKAAFLDFVVEVVRRIDKEPGFKVLPRRWVVERTFGWMTRWRRLVRDYEQRVDVSEAMMHVAMGSLLLRRISH